MHLRTLILLGMIITTCGCSTGHEHPILRALATKERNSVYVALWTLEQNGVLSEEDLGKIDLSPPYHKVRPRIREVQANVRALPTEKLNALDKSLSYYQTIYSPIWPSYTSYTWDSSADEEDHRMLERALKAVGEVDGRQPSSTSHRTTSPEDTD